MSLPGEENPNELNQQLFSVANNLDFQATNVEVEAGSSTQGEDFSNCLREIFEILSTPKLPEEGIFFPESEDFSYSCGPIFSPMSLPVQASSNELTHHISSVVNKNLQPDQLGMETGEQSGIQQLSYTALLMRGEGDQPNELPRPVNFQRDTEEGMWCSEPNRSHLEAANGLTPGDKAKNHLDQAGASAEGCIGRKRKAHTKEQDQQDRKLKKKDNCKKYREKVKMKLKERDDIKPQYDRLMEIATSSGGIDEMTIKLKELDDIKPRYDRLMEIASGSGGIDEMKMKLKELDDIKPQYDIVMEIATSSGGIDEMKMKLKELDDIKPQYDRLMELVTSSGGIDEMKMKLKELNDIKPQYNRLVKIAGIDEMGKQSHPMRSHEMKTNLNCRLQEGDIAHHVFQKVNETQFGQIMSKLYGGIQDMKSILDKYVKDVETETNRLEVMKFKKLGDGSNILELMKSKFGGIQETEAILDKLKQWEAELHNLDSMLNKLEQLETEARLFEKVMNMFGGIQYIEPGLEKLKKKTEFQQILKSTQQEMEFNSAQKEKEFIDFLPESPEFLQGQTQSVNTNDQGSIGDSIDGLAGYERSKILSLGLNTLYSGDDVSYFIQKLDNKDTKSNVNLSSFKGLDGEKQSVGDYKFPISLVSTAKAIMDAHGDIAKKCLINPSFVQDAYVLLCAAIREMHDSSLKQVNGDIMFRWRDAIMDAKRVGFDVEFAMEHLKNIAYAYFGIKALHYRNILERWKTNLKEAEKKLRQKLEKNAHEMEAIKGKVKELNSQQYCEKCQYYADYFKNQNVGLF